MADDIRLVIGVDDRDLIRTQKEQKKFERNLLIIEAAFRKGDITAKRYAGELNKQAKQMSRLGGSYNKANSDVRKYSASLRKATDDQLRMTQATNMAGKSTNRFGMYAQQVGYQVGDFFVQVQSGTSALVAFGQQGTQLAGLLPGVAGAVVGISLAVGTMLLRSFQQASGEAKTLSEAMENVQDSLEDYADAIDIINDINIETKFGRLASYMREAADESKRFAENMMFAGLDQAADRLDIASRGLSGIFERFWDRWTDTSGDIYSSGNAWGGGMGGVEISERGNIRKLGLEEVVTPEVMKGFVEGLKQAATSNDAKKSFELYRDMYKRVLSGLTDEQQKALPEKGQKFVEALKDQIDLLEKVVNFGRIEAKQRLATFRAENVELEAQARLLQTSIDFGKESDTYIQTALTNKVAAYEREQNALVGNKDIIRKHADILIEQFKQIQNLEVEEDARTERAKELTAEIKKAGRAMEQLGSFGLSVDKALAVAVAQLDALKTGGDAGVSGKVAGMRADVGTKTQAAIDSGGDPYDILLDQDAALKNIDLLETTLLKIESLKDAQKGSTKETGRQAVEKLIREAKHKQKVVTLTREQARYEEILFKAQETNATKKDPLDQKELQTAAQKVHLINEQTVALERQQKLQEDLAKTIASSMETSMMSMVDGTKSVKDAFRDMAADIVRHLYKVLVVQQMVNALGGFMSGSSNSAIASVGTEMSTMTLDGGGYTGNAPRSGGLDGKGGFMAMMHPRETVIDHTKANSGGGGQNVVINQSFNFQANGDDSVKKLIAQAAPQIANMTKKSMLDDRRRGGTTKAVFG